MIKVLNTPIQDKTITSLELIIIVGSCFFPLLIELPYRVNIFLSWEGAYRMYLGQIPYKDFGIPLGYGYFIVPFIFFKIFGPYLYTLVIAQIFINLASLFAFRNILKLLGMDAQRRIMAVLVFCLSYSFSNFWPWYNHSVFVYQLIGFNFLLLTINQTRPASKYLYLLLGSISMFLAFFTKQDSGALAIVFGAIILAYNGWATKNYSLLLLYLALVAITASVVIGPLLKYNFGYWFNHGQPPHSTRLKAIDFFNKIIGGSNWEKLYIGIIVIIFLKKTEGFREFIGNKKQVLFFLISFGVICQSLIIKITSPLPTDHQAYFHAFAFAYIIHSIQIITWSTPKYLLTSLLFIVLWWSALYWDYVTRIFHLPSSAPISPIAESPMSVWKTSSYKAFEHIKIPESAIDGIQRLKNLDLVKNKAGLKVLNMSELTPLAHELPYTPEINQPLWYHLNIGMFPKEVNEFCKKINNQHYDLILYQDIPMIPTFYPQEIRPCLDASYKRIDRFEAPRKRTEGDSYISVFVKK